MSKNANKNAYIRATKEGKLYIKTSDFFKQTKVKTLIDQLTESSIFKEIEQNKNSSHSQSAA